MDPVPNCATNTPTEKYREFRAYSFPVPGDWPDAARPVLLITQYRNYRLSPDEARALAAQLAEAAAEAEAAAGR